MIIIHTGDEIPVVSPSWKKGERSWLYISWESLGESRNVEASDWEFDDTVFTLEDERTNVSVVVGNRTFEKCNGINLSIVDGAFEYCKQNVIKNIVTSESGNLVIPRAFIVPFESQ